jgi:hypothetical protein
MSQHTSAASPNDRRGRGRVASRRNDPALEARSRRLHAQIVAENRPVSGRADRYVYYWAYGHLCWRLAAVPKDPRTPAQRRCRAAFAAASRAWSASQTLTQEQRDAWRAEAAMIKSTPRLGQSGPLTAQQHYVGRNSLKERWGSPLLLQPPKPETKKAEDSGQQPEPATQVQPRENLARPSTRTHPVCAGLALPPHPQRAAAAQKTSAILAPSQALDPQHLTRPSSGRPLTASGPCPGQHRWRARSPWCMGAALAARWPSRLLQVHRNGLPTMMRTK